MKSLFRCPVCGGPLDREERVYRCADRHSYDIAKEGYTYLLPPNQKHSADPGDDKAMSAARRDFLSKEYYMPLLNTLCSQILPLVGEHPVILDAGCGEGYYTAGSPDRRRENARYSRYRHLQIHPPAGRQTGKAGGVRGGLLLSSSLCE